MTTTGESLRRASTQAQTRNPELALWRSVISQALSDAVTKTKLPTLEQQRAQEWFERAGKDFKEVCHLAELEPDQVRSLAMRKIAEADAASPPERLFEHDGKSLTVRQWARELAIGMSSMRLRFAKLDAGKITAAEAFAAKQANPHERFHDAFGESLTLTQWGARMSIAVNTLRSRLKNGMLLEDALTKPVAMTRPKRKQRNNEPTCPELRTDQASESKPQSLRICPPAIDDKAA